MNNVIKIESINYKHKINIANERWDIPQQHNKEWNRKEYIKAYMNLLTNKITKSEE